MNNFKPEIVRKLESDKSKTRWMQEAFAAFLRDGGQLHPTDPHKWVVLVVSTNAPRHMGKPSDEAVADNPHLEFKRLPSYSLQRNVIEHFQKLRRRQATRNRFFESLKDRKRSIRASLGSFQTVKG